MDFPEFVVAFYLIRFLFLFCVIFGNNFIKFVTSVELYILRLTWIRSTDLTSYSNIVKLLLFYFVSDYVLFYLLLSKTD